MAVSLTAAACLTWLSGLTGVAKAALLAELEQEGVLAASGLVFLPYPAGERTPYNDRTVCGVFFGLEEAPRGPR